MNCFFIGPPWLKIPWAANPVWGLFQEKQHPGQHPAHSPAKEAAAPD